MIDGMPRLMIGAEIRELRNDLRIRARGEGVNTFVVNVLDGLLTMCLEDARLPPFARWILRSCVLHLAPVEGPWVKR